MVFIRAVVIIIGIILAGLIAAIGYIAFLSPILSTLQDLNPCSYHSSHNDHSFGSMNCLYRGTWLQQQIMWNRTAMSGGNAWDRLLLAAYWAIPTITKATPADVPLVNDRESLYVTIVQLLLIGVNGAVLGSAISILSDDNADSEQLLIAKETLHRKQGTAFRNHIPEHLLQRAINFLENLTSTRNNNMLLVIQDRVFEALPQSVRIKLTDAIRVPRVRADKLLNGLPSGIVSRIVALARLKIFSEEDHIITQGELGCEIYFLDQGVVDVMTGALCTKTIDSESDYAAFGEIILLDNRSYSNTIVVRSDICVCYVLTKDKLLDCLKLTPGGDATLIANVVALRRHTMYAT